MENKDIKIIGIHLHIFDPSGTKKCFHSNMIIINKILKTVYRFEPNNEDVDICETKDILDKKLITYFLRVPNFKGYKFHSSTSLPCFGLQITQAKERLSATINRGFCSAWSLWFLELSLLHPEVESDNLLRTIYSILKYKNKGSIFTKTILNYGEHIFEIMPPLPS
jgi:hypothetical protein